MEQQTHQEAHLPNEIVEVYRQPAPREVVLTYTRALPQSWLQPAPEPPRKQRSRRKYLWIFLVCFVVIALLAIFGHQFTDTNSSVEQAPDAGNKTETEQDFAAEISIPTVPFGQGAALIVLQEHGDTVTPQDIYRLVNPCVVTVMTRQNDTYSTMGTGVIFTSDGYILTNYHVLAGGSACTVSLDSGYTYEAFYVAGDADLDLAILKVDAADLPAAEFGDSDLLVVGDPAYAIGNPLNYELLGTMTDGIISAVDREMTVDGRTMTLLQTNAALNSGNSGGPLINQYGQVVGINVIKMSSNKDSVEGLGFAIPSAIIARAANDLLTYGELKPEPLLGISVIRVAAQVSDGIWGLEVDTVTEGSAADLAGVQTGDYVLAADGEPLLTSSDLLRVRRQHYLGEEMSLTLWRNGEIIEVVLHLQDAAE